MRAATPDRAGRDVRLVPGAALLVSSQLYAFPAVAPAVDVVFTADVPLAVDAFFAGVVRFAGVVFGAVDAFFAGVVDVVAADAFFARDAFVAVDAFFARDAFVAVDAFFARDAFVAADAFFARDAFVAVDAFFAGVVDVASADAFFARDAFVAAAPFFARDPFVAVDAFFARDAFVAEESSLLAFSADDVPPPWELDPVTLRRSEPSPREPSPVCCPDNAPIADTPDAVTERTADDPRICARRSSRSADRRSSAARARSRSAADTRPARSTAFSTSDPTMARRLARFAVAATRISSASAVTCAPIEVDVMLVGRLRSATAASRARARDSSASPEASWR